MRRSSANRVPEVPEYVTDGTRFEVRLPLVERVQAAAR